jgi:hypothetical protein
MYNVEKAYNINMVLRNKKESEILQSFTKTSTRMLISPLFQSQV